MCVGRLSTKSRRLSASGRQISASESDWTRWASLAVAFSGAANSRLSCSLRPNTSMFAGNRSTPSSLSRASRFGASAAQSLSAETKMWRLRSGVKLSSVSRSSPSACILLRSFSTISVNSPAISPPPNTHSVLGADSPASRSVNRVSVGGSHPPYHALSGSRLMASPAQSRSCVCRAPRVQGVFGDLQRLPQCGQYSFAASDLTAATQIHQLDRDGSRAVQAEGLDRPFQAVSCSGQPFGVLCGDGVRDVRQMLPVLVEIRFDQPQSSPSSPSTYSRASATSNTLSPSSSSTSFTSASAPARRISRSRTASSWVIWIGFDT